VTAVADRRIGRGPTIAAPVAGAAIVLLTGTVAATAVWASGPLPVLPFAVLGVLALTALAFLRPLAALALGIVAMPLEQVTGASGVSPSQGILLVTALAWAVRWAVSRPLQLPRCGALAAFAVLVLANAVGLLIAPEPGLVFRQVVNWGAFLLLFHLVVTADAARAVRVVTLAFVVCAGLIGLQTMLAPNAIQTAGFSTAGVVRAAGVFGSPNALGIFLAMAIPVQIAYVLRGPARLRPVAAVALVPAAIALMQTVSRGATVGLGVALLVLACWAPFRRIAVVGLVLVAAMAVAGPTSVSASLNGGDIVHRLTDSDKTAANDPRSEIYRRAPQMIADRPLFGMGALQYAHYSTEYGLPTTQGVITHAHNIWLTMAVELGLLGLGAFVWLVASLALAGRRAVRRLGGFERGLAFALGAALSAVAAEGLVDYAFSTSLFAAEFFLLAACLVALSRR
jgi:O-antigen ligase